MARELFINTHKHEQLKTSIEDSLYFNSKKFKEVVSEAFKNTVRDSLSGIDLSIQKNLFFIGSFSRGEPTLYSDLDLLLIGEHSKEKIDVLVQTLRDHFRKHSLLRFDKIQDTKEIEDAKTMLSLNSLEPVFEVEKDTDFKIKISISEIKESVIERRKRYGNESGRLKFHLKYSCGGLLDLNILHSIEQRSYKQHQDFHAFLYKLRSLQSIKNKGDSFFAPYALEFYEIFGFQNAEGFHDYFYENVFEVSKSCQKALNLKESFHQDQLRTFSDKKEALEIEQKIESLRGVVNSVNYHYLTVGEHLWKALSLMMKCIDENQNEFQLSQEEKEVLCWSVLFHDLGKDQKEVAHSLQGSRYVKEFGKKHNWSVYQKSMVSWLVREHLTLSKHAFKSDPYNPVLIERLVARGVEGRRAVLLFLLTSVDIQATNPNSWSHWKKEVLRSVLDKVLGLDSKIDASISQLVNIERLKLVPQSILAQDLSGRLEEGFAIYEGEAQSLWVRYFKKTDELGLASKILTQFQQMGVYVHQAFFSTQKETDAVYNFFKVEVGISKSALEKRLKLMMTQKTATGDPALSEELKRFHKIQLRYLQKEDSYAVVSFKGKDDSGLLLSAVNILFELNMSILWGHAFTWGEDVEDVFGVKYSDSQAWARLGLEHKLI